MKFRNPAATVDLILENKNKEILLIKRKDDPFKDMWALPGGHIDYYKETLENAATRELEEETNYVVDEKDLILFGVYSEPNRDPRDHYISHVYIVRKYSGNLQAGDDAKEAKYFSFDNLPGLAFDHDKILGKYLEVRTNGHPQVKSF